MSFSSLLLLLLLAFGQQQMANIEHFVGAAEGEEFPYQEVETNPPIHLNLLCDCLQLIQTCSLKKKTLLLLSIDVPSPQNTAKDQDQKRDELPGRLLPDLLRAEAEHNFTLCQYIRRARSSS